MADRRPGRSPRARRPGDLIPATSTGSYDVRQVAAAIVDEDSLLEIRDRWAANVVTAFATIGGRPVGIVANQPVALAGTLDIPGSQKAARFVSFCDAFNLPLLTLVDTPGFYPGKDLEWRGMIRHGAQLVFAYARATVPRLCVILRKSYGGAYIVMDSKTMGNDVLPRLAVGRAGGDGRRAGGGDPAAPGDARGAGGVRGRLQRAAAQPLRRRRPGLRRRGDRARPRPAASSPPPSPCSTTSASSSRPASTATSPLSVSRRSAAGSDVRTGG